jgi:hypothetical protein
MILKTTKNMLHRKIYLLRKNEKNLEQVGGEDILILSLLPASKTFLREEGIA